MSASRLEDEIFASLKARAGLLGVNLAQSTNEHGAENIIASKQPLDRQHDHLTCWVLDTPEEVERLLSDLGGCSAEQADLQPNKKVDATFVARAALAGFELVRLADGTWLASRWGMFRGLADVEQVERFLSVVGAPE